MTDYEELRYEMQYYENEHYNELRKLEKEENVENVKMKGYKAYEKGLICKGKQYAENTLFEEPKAEICESGMHFCCNPFDVRAGLVLQ